MGSTSETKPNSPETVTFLQVTNPEVFKAKPRLGGYIHLKKDEVEEKKNEVVQKESRDFRVTTALDDDTFSIKSIEAPIPTPLKDAMYMLSTTISTLIMMAVDFKGITADHLDWAEKYLDCVKDDYGNHPPNVQGILNHIKTVSPSAGGASSGPQPTEGDDSDERTVRSTTRVKMGSQTSQPEA